MSTFNHQAERLSAAGALQQVWLVDVKSDTEAPLIPCRQETRDRERARRETREIAVEADGDKAEGEAAGED